MTDPTRPDDGTPRDAGDQREGPRPDPRLVAVAVTVTRTGGFAGLRRTWHAQPEAMDAPQWIALIEGCPWEAADPTRPLDTAGADRFVWHVDARCGDAEREAALADPDVRGPWRELIDAVRSAGSADSARAAGPRPPQTR
jgi:hypothetical protein